jgi:stress response protein YsnF
MSGGETVIPVVEEALLLHKKEVRTGTLRVKTVTDNLQEFVKADLSFSNVAVTRVPVGREVEAMPDVRVEGNVTIVPVVEERLVVEKRLFLKEELRLTHTQGVETVEIPVAVRKQRVEVTREPAQRDDRQGENDE